MGSGRRRRRRTEEALWEQGLHDGDAAVGAGALDRPVRELPAAAAAAAAFWLRARPPARPARRRRPVPQTPPRRVR